MTTREYITSKLASFGANPSDADFLDMLSSSSLTEDTELDADKINLANMAIIGYIPSLLTQASVSESGFSISFNSSGLKEYYHYLCKKYGYDDILNDDKPHISFL